MSNEIKLYALNLDCTDPNALARFYAELLKWDIVYSDEEYACVAAPGTQQGASTGISFQRNPMYKPPVWPEEEAAQQQMAHIDFAVNDLDATVKHAISCGAKFAAEQFSDGWMVMLDPAGHPFCLCLIKDAFQEN